MEGTSCIRLDIDDVRYVLADTLY